MSYILDALKKAESERKLGSVPNIHAHTVTAPAFGMHPAGASKRWLWLTLAGIIALISLASWYFFQPAPPAPITVADTTENAVEPTPPAAARDSAEMPVAAPQPEASVDKSKPQKSALPKVAAASAAPIAAQGATPIVAATPALGASLTVTRELAAKPEPPPAAPPVAYTLPPEPFKPSVDLRPPKTPMPERPVPIAKLTEPAPAPMAEVRVGTQRELPENIQREIPAVAINGYIYSSIPAERSMLINTILRREGDQVAPNLILEKMMPKEAIFNYKGYRYRTGYQ